MSTLQTLNIERLIDRLEEYRQQLDQVTEEARQLAENLEFDMDDLLHQPSVAKGGGGGSSAPAGP